MISRLRRLSPFRQVPSASCVTIALPFAGDCPKFAEVLIHALLRVLALRGRYPVSLKSPCWRYGTHGYQALPPIIGMLGGSRYLIHLLSARLSTNAVPFNTKEALHTELG